MTKYRNIILYVVMTIIYFLSDFTSNIIMLSFFFIFLYKLSTNIGESFIVLIFALIPLGLVRQSNSFGYASRISQYGENLLPTLFFPNVSGSINITNFDLTIQLLIVFFCLAYFIFNRHRYSKLNFKFSTGYFIYLVLIGIALISALISIARGNNGSLMGLYSLSSLSFFFLFQSKFTKLFRNAYYRNYLTEIIISIILICSALVLLGIISNHFVFIFIPLACSLLLSPLRLHTKILLLLSILYISFNSTFTILTLIFSSLLTTFLIKTNKISFYSLVRAFSVIFILFLILTLYSKDFLVRMQSGVSELLFNKLFLDRFYVWESTINNITVDDIFYKIIDFNNESHIDFRGVEKSFDFGSHNVLLNMIRFLGVIPGFIYFSILISIFLKLAKKVKSSEGLLTYIFVGLINCFFVYGLTNHSIIIHPSSIIFWSLLGIVSAIICTRFSYE